ncbi:hypothetical protein VQ056_15910 [Paenibacillus sp. JTLBN-2024]
MTGASWDGWIFRILRPLVHTSNEQPTPQNVHTVFVLRVLVSRIAASISEMAKMPLYPGSTSLTRSIIGSRIGLSIAVMNPASPSIDFSIGALHGQIVTHCPQLTQEESLMDTPSSHLTRGMSASQSIDSVSLT